MGPERRAEKDELSGVGKQEMLEQQAAREAKEEAAFQELMREVFGGMAGTEENNHDDKQAAMYKQWERHVFHNIQNQIAKKLKKLTPDQISKKLRMSPK
jgi:xanthine dehydrogenase iron-sulfur cluster and FAD-binding subunit A